LSLGVERQRDGGELVTGPRTDALLGVARAVCRRVGLRGRFVGECSAEREQLSRSCC
jgi:hypothetical protein